MEVCFANNDNISRLCYEQLFTGMPQTLLSLIIIRDGKFTIERRNTHGIKWWL